MSNHDNKREGALLALEALLDVKRRTTNAGASYHYSTAAFDAADVETAILLFAEPAAPATDAEPVDGRHHFSPDTDNPKHGHCAHCGQPILWTEAGEYCAANVPPSAAQLAAAEARGRASAQTRIDALREALGAVAWIKCTYCRGTNHASAALRADDAAAKEEA